jgi:DNA-binding XRE family transcriptional regulator
MNNNMLSIRLKELRNSRNHSQKTLGEAIGLSMQTINDIEKGRSNTTLEKAIAIADYFDVSLDYLVGRSDDPKR